MSDFLSRIASNAPAARELTFAGETGTVYVRKITAGQRAQLLSGQRVSTSGEGKSSIEIDLGENELSKAKLVAFAICHEDGKPFFTNERAVSGQPADLVSALYKIASEYNADEVGKD